MATDLACHDMHWVFRMKSVKTRANDGVIRLSNGHWTTVNAHSFLNCLDYRHVSPISLEVVAKIVICDSYLVVSTLRFTVRVQRVHPR